MWPGRGITSVTKPVEIGLSEGRPVSVLLLRRNVLIGGIMGSGKSGVLNVIIANLAGCRNVVLWGIDLKGGMELQPWAGVLLTASRSPRTRQPSYSATRLGNSTSGPRGWQQPKRVWEPTPDDTRSDPIPRIAR